MKANHVLPSAVLLLAGAVAPPLVAGPIKADKNKAPSVAVFPFKLLNADARLAHLGEGAADAVINKLVNDKALRVVEESQLDKAINALARNQSGLFEDESVLVIGQMVDARYVIIGSVQVMAEQLAVNARVLEVESRQLLASERVFGPLPQAFALYDEIAAKLLSKLTYHLAQRVVAGESADAIAVRQLIDEAKSHDPLYPAAAGVSKDFQRALALYDKAALRDPTNSVAQLALGHAQSRHAANLQTRDPAGATRYLEMARDHLRRATELAKDNVFAWIELGRVYGRMQKHAAARDAFRTALALEANNVDARFGLAVALYNGADYDGAREQAQMARDLGHPRADGLVSQIDQAVAMKRQKPNPEK
jgi:TolB-like protein